MADVTLSRALVVVVVVVAWHLPPVLPYEGTPTAEAAQHARPAVAPRHGPRCLRFTLATGDNVCTLGGGCEVLNRPLALRGGFDVWGDEEDDGGGALKPENRGVHCSTNADLECLDVSIWLTSC